MIFVLVPKFDLKIGGVLRGGRGAEPPSRFSGAGVRGAPQAPPAPDGPIHWSDRKV